MHNKMEKLRWHTAFINRKSGVSRKIEPVGYSDIYIHMLRHLAHTILGMASLKFIG